jgi:hypothetical protein
LRATGEKNGTEDWSSIRTAFLIPNECPNCRRAGSWLIPHPTHRIAEADGVNGPLPALLLQLDLSQLNLPWSLGCNANG